MDASVFSQLSPEEAAPFYARFLAAFAPDEVGPRLRSQPQQLRQLCSGLDEAAALGAYQPGKWSIKEVIGHILDTERVLAYRLLRIGRSDRTPLGGFDETTYVPAGQFNRRSLDSLLAEFEVVRANTLALAEGLPPEAWGFMGTANGYPTSARALVLIVLGHTGHHLELLQRLYGLPKPNVP